MGAWGAGVFENDGACDFAVEVTKRKDLSKLDRALDVVLREENYLEAPAATEGLAAADIVARLRDHFGQTGVHTKEIDGWAKKMKIVPDDQMTAKARQVVDRVGRQPSELLELWSEEDASEWLVSLEELKQRLLLPPATSAQDGKKSVFDRLFRR